MRSEDDAKSGAQAHSPFTCAHASSRLSARSPMSCARAHCAHTSCAENLTWHARLVDLVDQIAVALVGIARPAHVGFSL